VVADVNPARPSRQRERSSRTRHKILEAARERFAADGYVATTLDAVAGQAGVAVQTVKFVFHTKAALLLDVVRATAADDQARTTPEQPWFLEATSGQDAHRALALTVDFGTAIYERLAPLSAAIATAATLDEEVASQRARTVALRRGGMQRVIAALHDCGGLTPNLDVERATDVMFVLQSPEQFQAFTAACGWPVPQYKAWQYGTLCATLLASTTKAARLKASRDLSFASLVR
jgi:AcrR family transcriptional regulator